MTHERPATVSSGYIYRFQINSCDDSREKRLGLFHTCHVSETSHPSDHTLGVTHGRPASRAATNAGPPTYPTRLPHWHLTRLRLRPWTLRATAYVPGVTHERPATAAGPPTYEYYYFPGVIHFFPTGGAFSPDPLSFSPHDISKFRVRHETRRGV